MCILVLLDKFTTQKSHHQYIYLKHGEILVLFSIFFTQKSHHQLTYLKNGVNFSTSLYIYLPNKNPIVNLFCCFALQALKFDYAVNIHLIHDITSYLTYPVSHKFLCYILACMWHVWENFNKYYVFTMIYNTTTCVNDFKLKYEHFQITLVTTVETEEEFSNKLFFSYILN